MEVYAIYRHYGWFRWKSLLWLEADRTEAESEVDRLNKTLGAGTYSCEPVRVLGLRSEMLLNYQDWLVV